MSKIKYNISMVIVMVLFITSILTLLQTTHILNILPNAEAGPVVVEDEEPNQEESVVIFIGEYVEPSDTVDIEVVIDFKNGSKREDVTFASSLQFFPNYLKERFAGISLYTNAEMTQVWDGETIEIGMLLWGIENEPVYFVTFNRDGYITTGYMDIYELQYMYNFSILYEEDIQFYTDAEMTQVWDGTAIYEGIIFYVGETKINISLYFSDGNEYIGFLPKSEWLYSMLEGQLSTVQFYTDAEMTQGWDGVTLVEGMELWGLVPEYE